MNQLLYLLVALACPLSMLYIMRGMHGGHAGHAPSADDRRIGDLEREVIALRAGALEDALVARQAARIRGDAR